MLNRSIVLDWLKVVAVVGAFASAASGSALPYPTTPYSTIGAPLPTLYCRNAMDGGTALVGPSTYWLRFWQWSFGLSERGEWPLDRLGRSLHEQRRRRQRESGRTGDHVGDR